MKLNGVIIALSGTDSGRRLTAPGVSMSVRVLDDDEVDWRSNAELIFRLNVGVTVGYWGFHSCEDGGPG